MAHEHGGNIFAVARTLGKGPEEILDFSASINPLGMAPAVPAALAASLDRLLHYPDKNATELREALAAYHDIHAREITVANGSTELIHLLPRVVRGKRGLIVAPAFAEYALALKRAGWEVDYFLLDAENGFTLSVAALQEKMKEGYDLLFICNPGNPTGKLISQGDIALIVELCRRSRTFLVLDEAFIDFFEYESAKHFVRRSSGAILLRSMTKFFAIPGLRLGYAIGSPEIIEALASFQDPWSVNTAAQVAGIASLADVQYRQRTRDYVERERLRMVTALCRLRQVRLFKSQANFLLVQILEGPTAPELRSMLMEKGILIRDCSNFVGLDNTFFRVAVRLQEENDRLLEEIQLLFTDVQSNLPEG
jgi:threonine-phosphate decarboxylase